MGQARDKIMWEEAYRLARSGDHSSYLSIEWELKGRFRKAHSLLGDDRAREKLNRMCDEARKGRTDAPRP